MSKSDTSTLTEAQVRPAEWSRQIVIVVGASLFIALCARLTYLLPGNPVPLTLQNFGVLVVGLVLGSRAGFAALALYLAEGAAGFPVFSPAGPGGIVQLLGPTGGYLMAYPFVAGVAGLIFEHGKKTFAGAVASGLIAEVLLFTSGVGWLAATVTHSLSKAVFLGLYWFAFAEVIKIMFAAGVAVRMRRGPKAAA